jgi:purine-cytosine permease-like protein
MYTPPARKSMSDAELQDALGAAKADESGIMGAMELLEKQSSLREEDNREFDAWVVELEAIGSAEALHAVENGRRILAGLEPLVFEPVAVEVETPQPEVDPVDESSPEPEPEPESAPTSGTATVAFDDIADSLNAFYGGASKIQPHSEPAAEPLVEPEAVTVPAAAPVSTPEAIPAADLFDQILSAEDVATEEQEAHFPPVFSAPADLEVSEDQKRSGKAISQLWPWLAISSGLLPIALAYLLFSSNLTIQESLSAVGIGFGLSGLTVAAGALAGKRSGLPTLLLSRSAFGVFGNQLPGWFIAILRIATPIAIVAVLMALLVQQPASEKAYTFNSNIGFYTGGAIAAVIVAVAAYLALSQRIGKQVRLWATIAALLLTLFVAASAATRFNFSNIDFSNSASVTIASSAAGVFIFAIFGVLWASAGADNAMALSKQSRGLATIGWTLLGASVAPALITSWFLFAFFGATGELTEQLNTSFRATSTFLGGPLESVLLVLTALLWLQASFGSADLALSSLGVRKLKVTALVVLAIASLAGGAVVWQLLAPSDTWSHFSSIALVLGIPASAWAGVFVSDVLLRRIAYHEVSLSRAYGFYKSVNVANLLAWIIAVTLGAGFLVSSRPELQLLGFLASATGTESQFQDSNLGLLMAFGVGLVAPIAAGIPRIKRQEAEVLAIEARRDDLKDIFKFSE